MNETPEQYIAVSEVERLLREDNTVILIDARTADEFAEGHVPGAINVSIPDLAEFVRNRDHTVGGLLITMCGSTGRGEKAAAALASLGAKYIAILHGGLKAWKEAGYPVA